MQTYDTALKLLFQSASDALIPQVACVPVVRWLNVETPQVQNLRLDLLGIAADASLVHIELQSTNDLSMPLRMAEYYLRVFRQHKQFPRQFVLYVGKPKLTMEATLTSPAINFSYRLLAIRDLDASPMLASSHIEDNLLAIRTSSKNPVETIRAILDRQLGRTRWVRSDQSCN